MLIADSPYEDATNHYIFDRNSKPELIITQFT